MVINKMEWGDIKLVKFSTKKLKKTIMNVPIDWDELREKLDKAVKIMADTAKISLSFGKNRLAADLSGEILTSVPTSWKGKAAVEFEHIQGPKFINRNLKGVQLNDAFLVKADFSGSDLTGANFSNADARMMSFKGAYEENEGWGLLLSVQGLTLGYLKSERFVLPILNNVNFTNADLRFAKLFAGGYSDSEFTHADLRNASIASFNGEGGPFSFVGADLRETVLSGTGWNKTLFYGARLEGADLSEVKGLTEKNFAFVTFDEKTRFPDKITTPTIIGKPLTELQSKILINLLREKRKLFSDNLAKTLGIPTEDIFNQYHEVAHNYFADEGLVTR